VVNSESDTLQSAAALSHYGGYGVVHCAAKPDAARYLLR
jgi:hypothetical protein